MRRAEMERASCEEACAIAKTQRETFCNGLKKEMERLLPRSRRAAMLCLMRSYLHHPVCLPLPRKVYRCKYETFHQLQACRIAQAGGS